MAIKLNAIPHVDFDINDIEFGERFRKEYTGIDELAASIKENGLIHPISVCKNPEDSGHPVRLVTGGRRYTAIKKLIDNDNYSTRITCRLFDEIDEVTLRTLELMENVQRKSMTFMEEQALRDEIHRLQVSIHGHKIGKSTDSPGHSMTDTAKLLNVSPSMIRQDQNLFEKAKALAGTGLVDFSEMKTRTEVKRAVDQFERQATRKVGAAKAKKSLGETKDEKVQALLDAYRIEDCTIGMKAIGSSTIDLVEIDPPYAINLNVAKKGMENGYDGYNEIAPHEYISLMRKVFDECWRIMAPNSWLICWYGPEPWAEVMYHLISGGTERSAKILYANLIGDNNNKEAWRPEHGDARFKTHRLCGTWIKDRGQTKQPNLRFGNAYEPFYYARKGDPKMNKPGHNNTFVVPSLNPKEKIHPTERPADLISTILDTFTHAGSRVVVPFAGSGRTLIEAVKLNMIPIGFDLHDGYKEAFTIEVTKKGLN